MAPYRLFVALLAFVFVTGTASAQPSQLSPPMNAVLSQEGQLKSYPVGDLVPDFVNIGPNSRKDRLAILAHCQSELQGNWSIVEQQSGFDRALSYTTAILASATDLLTKSRQGARELGELKAANEAVQTYGGVVRASLVCVFGKAVDLASAGTPTRPAPATAQSLGPNASKVLLIEQGNGWQVRQDSRADRAAILQQCQALVDARFQSSRRDTDPANSIAKLLSGPVTSLWLARNGDPSDLNYDPKSVRNEFGENDQELLELGLCFKRAARALFNRTAPQPAPAPVAVASPAQATAKPSQLSDATRLASINAFRAEFKALRERYPWVTGWSEAEQNQHRLFMGTKALEILGRLKPGMEKEEYDTMEAPAIEMRDQGRAGCPVCKAEYPVPSPLPSAEESLATPVPPSEVGVIGVLHNVLNNSAAKAPLAAPAVVAPATPKKQPPKITMMAALGNGCVTALGRNYRLHEFDKSTQLIDLVLKNSCAKAQVVKVDVSGLGMLGWPAIYNLGLWASTANADVPAGIPFNPLRAMSEGGTYMIPANGEHVADRWVPPPPIGSDNELKIWVASCDAYSASGMQQVVFRPAAHFAQDSRAFCGPSRLR